MSQFKSLNLFMFILFIFSKEPFCISMAIMRAFSSNHLLTAKERCPQSIEEVNEADVFGHSNVRLDTCVLQEQPVGFLLMAELYFTCTFSSLHFIVVHRSSLTHSLSFLNIFLDKYLPEALYVLTEVLLSFDLSFYFSFS